MATADASSHPGQDHPDTSVRGTLSSGAGKCSSWFVLPPWAGVLATAGAGLRWLAWMRGRRAWLRACRSSAPGTRSSRDAVWVPVTWVFSLYVVQAGSAWPGMGRAGLLLQRSTGLVRSSRRPGGELPRVSDGVGPLRRDGLALPLIGEKVSGTCGGCGWKRWSSGLRLTAGEVLVAGGGSGIPASVVDHHGVDPAQQRGGARDPGLGPPRPGFRGCRAGLP
jgi:hypothetical protein